MNASAKMDSNQSTTPIKAITPSVATVAQTTIPIVTAWFILLPRFSSKSVERVRYCDRFGMRRQIRLTPADAGKLRVSIA